MRLVVPDGKHPFAEADDAAYKEPTFAEPFPQSLETIFDPNNPDMDPLTFQTPIFRGVVVTGHPGIGKSVFSVLLLLICLARSQCVMIQFYEDIIHVFDHTGVYRFKIADLAEKRTALGRFPPHLWCLVDCNQGLRTVDSVLTKTAQLVIHTAPARKEHFEWIKHSTTRPDRSPYKYYMAPWTLDELLIVRPFALSLQTTTESELRAFHSRWGPSIREASMRARLQIMLKDQESRVTAFIYNNVRGVDALRIDMHSNTFSDDAFNSVVLVQPSKGCRTIPHVSIVTGHVLAMVIKRILLELEGQRYYDLFLRLAETRTAACDLFRARVHREASHGCSWPIQPYRSDDGELWSPVDNGPKRTYIHIGHEDQGGTGRTVIVDNRMSVPTAALLSAGHFTARGPASDFNPGIYHSPLAESLTVANTFDSVIFDTSIQNVKRATVFQCAVNTSTT
ncbi:hypothetical protein OF83DRAFT_377350 [Amylostereum chailletii]|nr:hypothetical protein OF83DRAFT_377350 [Amylostereum chailletii]